LIKRIFFIFNILFIFFLPTNTSLADLQADLINKFKEVKTLSFNFKQKIADKEEVGKCFIKYPLLLKCNYKDLKQKVIISNGKTVAVIKKKYKKIYFYPLKSTPLFFILHKEKIINLIDKKQPTKISSDKIEFIFTDKKKNKIKILFDRNSLELKGWETKDAYSNNVSFIISNLITNNQIIDDFFKIPKEKDL
jgi:outer membrane lipoprotein-sorting protein